MNRKIPWGRYYLLLVDEQRESIHHGGGTILVLVDEQRESIHDGGGSVEELHLANRACGLHEARDEGTGGGGLTLGQELQSELVNVLVRHVPQVGQHAGTENAVYTMWIHLEQGRVS